MTKRHHSFNIVNIHYIHKGKQMSIELNEKKLLQLDSMDVIYWLDHFNFQSPTVFIEEVVNGKIDLDIMRRSIFALSVGAWIDAQDLAEDMYGDDQ